VVVVVVVVVFVVIVVAIVVIIFMVVIIVVVVMGSSDDIYDVIQVVAGPRILPCGLANLGNSCYINSVLQILRRCELVVSQIAEIVKPVSVPHLNTQLCNFGNVL
jgi:hypothetical protein